MGDVSCHRLVVENSGHSFKSLSEMLATVGAVGMGNGLAMANYWKCWLQCELLVCLNGQLWKTVGNICYSWSCWYG